MGLRAATDKTWGMMRLKTIGRKSGRERVAILGYFEDGSNLVTMAMNGWGAPETAWWLNLQANSETTVQLHDRTLAIRGRVATSDERPRLWELWRRYDGEGLDAWAARRPRETPVVILEPRIPKSARRRPARRHTSGSRLAARSVQTARWRRPGHERPKQVSRDPDCRAMAHGHLAAPRAVNWKCTTQNWFMSHPRQCG